MKNQFSEKVLGAALVVTVCVSFVGTTDVHAQPVFPPAPHDRNANFVEPLENAQGTSTGPWYRPTVPVAVIANEAAYIGERQFAAAGAEVTPWYRTAN